MGEKSATINPQEGTMEEGGAFCKFYEQQVRYAFRLIADGKESAFLWDNWEKGTKQLFRL